MKDGNNRKRVWWRGMGVEGGGGGVGGGEGVAVDEGWGDCVSEGGQASVTG